MKLWGVLIAALLSLPSLVTAQTDHWQESYFPRELLEHFINNRKCLSSDIELGACRMALHSVQSFLGIESKIDQFEFEQAFRELETLRDRGTSVQELYGRALNAYLRTFDPYAEIKPSAQVMEENTGPEQSFVGVGLILDVFKSEVIVHELIEDSPAARAGILADDVVTGIALKDREFYPIGNRIDIANSLLAGEVKSRLTIRIRRDGKDIEYALRRAIVKEPYVTSKWIDETTAYVRIHSFANFEIRQKVATELKKFSRAKKLILDLRGNSGGEKSEAVYVASLFLGPKKIVGTSYITNAIPELMSLMKSETAVEASGAIGVLWDTGILERARFNGQLIVLVDADTASSSEILAGALQDHNRAWIVGERTQGKGTAQYYERIPEFPTLTLKWTTQRWIHPSGRTSQAAGVYPNFEVARRAGDEARMASRSRESDKVTGGLDREANEWVEPRFIEVERIRECLKTMSAPKLAGSDQQLAFAINVFACEKNEPK